MTIFRSACTMMPVETQRIGAFFLGLEDTKRNLYIRI